MVAAAAVAVTDGSYAALCDVANSVGKRVSQGLDDIVLHDAADKNSITIVPAVTTAASTA
jgi:hypothetical protein